MHGDHAWYTYVLIIIGYAICITIWAFAPLFLPALLFLSCHIFSFTRYIRKLMDVLTFILLIVSAYVWMVPILSWGYPWLIGLPIGFCVVSMAVSTLLSLFGGDSKNEYINKSDAEVLTIVAPIIVDMLGVDEWEVVLEARLGDDLGCDDYDLKEEKCFFSLHFARFSLTLTCGRRYFRSKIKRKTSFPFVFCSLIRTFATDF